MRRILLPTLLILLLATSQALAVSHKKAAKPAPAGSAEVAPAPVFDEAAFREHFAAGLTGRPNAPKLSAQDVKVESAEKAADFAGTQIYVVRGVLAPAQGQSQPFLMFVSADGRYYISDIVDMREGRSILKDARDRARAMDARDMGHVVLKGQGTKPVVFVSDPFCPYCRQAFAYLMGKRAAMGEFRLAHYPLPGHAGADMACVILAWAEQNAPAKLEAMVTFAYGKLAMPKVTDRGQEQLHAARVAVAESFLAEFPELKAVGENGGAIVETLSQGAPAESVQADMARAAGMGIDGTPIIFVGGARVEGFDKNRLDEVLK